MNSSPVIFHLASTPVNTADEIFVKIKEALNAVSTVTDSGYAFDFQAIAFANHHPETGEVVLEVQAHSQEDSVKGMEIVSNVLLEVADMPLIWNDVTEAALAYHAEQRKENETN